MKHSATRDLYCYWDGLRGARVAPERQDIDPGAIRRILTDTFIVEVDEAGNYPFRLAGTRVCGLFGHELRGTSLLDPFRAIDQMEIRRLLDAVTDDAAAVVVGLEARSNQGASLDLELLLLPLRHRGRTHARILGSLTTTDFPYWVGVCPIVSLAVRSSRVLGARARLMPLEQDETAAEPLAFRSPAQAAIDAAIDAVIEPGMMRRVAHLAVIQGGRR